MLTSASSKVKAGAGKAGNGNNSKTGTSGKYSVTDKSSTSNKSLPSLNSQTNSNLSSGGLRRDSLDSLGSGSQSSMGLPLKSIHAPAVAISRTNSNLAQKAVGAAAATAAATANTATSAVPMTVGDDSSKQHKNPNAAAKKHHSIIYSSLNVEDEEEKALFEKVELALRSAKIVKIENEVNVPTPSS